MAPFAVVAPVLGPCARPHPRRPPAAVRGRDARAGRACASLMANYIHSYCSTRSRSARSCCRRGNRSRRARSCRRSSTTKTSSCSPTRASPSSRSSARHDRRAVSAAAILKLHERALGCCAPAPSSSCSGPLRRSASRGTQGRQPTRRVDERERVARAEHRRWRERRWRLLRGVVGFFTFFAAFALKRAHEPAWVFGVVLIGSALGNGVGMVLAPLLRKKIREEWILAGALLVPAVPLVFAGAQLRRVSLARRRGRDGRRIGGVRARRVRQPAPARRARSRSRARVRALRDAVPDRVGDRRRVAVVVPGWRPRRHLRRRVDAVVRGLSYVGGFRRSPSAKCAGAAAATGLELPHDLRDPRRSRPTRSTPCCSPTSAVSGTSRCRPDESRSVGARASSTARASRSTRRASLASRVRTRSS